MILFCAMSIHVPEASRGLKEVQEQDHIIAQGQATTNRTFSIKRTPSISASFENINAYQFRHNSVLSVQIKLKVLQFDAISKEVAIKHLATLLCFYFQGIEFR